MAKKQSDKNGGTQYQRFIETARALGCDEDKERFEKSLSKIAAFPSKKPSKEPAKPAAKMKSRR